MLAVFVLVSFACALPVSLPAMEEETDESNDTEENPLSIIENLMEDETDVGSEEESPLSIIENLMEGEIAESSDEEGITRQAPLPVGMLLSVPGWEMQVVEFLRGDEALQVIQSTGQKVGELPDGKEFALAKLFVRCTALDSNAHDLTIPELFITGNQHIAYGDMLDGIPQPEFLYEDMYSAEAVEGWIDAIIPEDERDLMVVLDLKEYEEDRVTRYLALEKGASISLPENFDQHKPNETGVSVNSPAAIGEQINTPEWEITILDAFQGEQAETILRQDNPSFKPPEEGMQYVLLEMKLNYFGEKDLPTNIGKDNFYAVDENGRMLEEGRARAPTQSEKNWISGNVFPGAALEGWIVLSIPAGLDQTVLAFDPDRYNYEKDDPIIRYLFIE
jgi:hypothetical protein